MCRKGCCVSLTQTLVVFSWNARLLCLLEKSGKLLKLFKEIFCGDTTQILNCNLRAYFSRINARWGDWEMLHKWKDVLEWLRLCVLNNQDKSYCSVTKHLVVTYCYLLHAQVEINIAETYSAANEHNRDYIIIHKVAENKTQQRHLFSLRVKLPPAHLSPTHGGGFTLSFSIA